MIGQTFRRMICALLSFSTVVTSVVPFSAAQAAPGAFNAQWRDVCGIYDCSFSVSAPQDAWVEMEGVSDLAGLKGLTGDAALKQFAGDSWMSAGDAGAGILRANNAQAAFALGSVPQSKDMPVWVVAKYFFQEKQLRIHAIKSVRGVDGVMRLYQTHYTPHHGTYHVARASFVNRQVAATSASPRGVDPFSSFNSGDRTDPVFYNIGAAAAEVAVGLAMEHFQASHGVWIDALARVSQWTHVVKRWYGKKTYINTAGYVRPSFSLISPVGMGLVRGSGTMSNFAVTCPAGDGQCGTHDELAFSGITKQKISEDLVDEIEEQIYGTHTEMKRSYGTLMIMLAVGIGVLAAGAMAAGAASWSYVGGYGVAATANIAGAAYGTVLAGSTVAAAAAGTVGLLVYSSYGNSSNVNTWNSSAYSTLYSSVQPSSVKKGNQAATDCGNQHCRATNATAKQRHITTALPGVDRGNLIGANNTLAERKVSPGLFAPAEAVFRHKTAADYKESSSQCGGDASCIATSFSRR